MDYETSPGKGKVCRPNNESLMDTRSKPNGIWEEGIPGIMFPTQTELKDDVERVRSEFGRTRGARTKETARLTRAPWTSDKTFSARNQEKDIKNLIVIAILNKAADLCIL